MWKPNKHRALKKTRSTKRPVNIAHPTTDVRPFQGAKSVSAPIDDGEPPILIRNVTLRKARTIKKYHAGQKIGWEPLCFTLHKNVVEASGLEAGMTMVIEAYRNKVVRLFPAGDLISREDGLI